MQEAVEMGMRAKGDSELMARARAMANFHGSSILAFSTKEQKGIQELNVNVSLRMSFGFLAVADHQIGAYGCTGESSLLS